MCVSVGVWIGNNPQRVGGEEKKRKVMKKAHSSSVQLDMCQKISKEKPRILFECIQALGGLARLGAGLNLLAIQKVFFLFIKPLLFVCLFVFPNFDLSICSFRIFFHNFFFAFLLSISLISEEKRRRFPVGPPLPPTVALLTKNGGCLGGKKERLEKQPL